MSEMKIYDGDLVYASFTKYYAYVDISQNKLYETDCRVIYERLASNDYRITRDSQNWLEVFDSTRYRDDDGKEPPFYGSIRRIAVDTKKRTLCVRDRSLCYRPQFRDYIMWPTDQCGYRSFGIDTLYGVYPSGIVGSIWDVYAIRKLGLKVLYAA